MDNPVTELKCWRASETDPEQIQQWHDLYLNSVSPNVYMSPDFVLSALSTFCRDDPVIVSITGDDRLLGLGILQENERSLAYPFRSMKLFKTIYSFQSGVLLRAGITDEAVDVFLRDMLDHGCSCISFNDFAMSTATAEKLFASARRQGFHWYETGSYSRPTLDLCMSFNQWKAARKKVVRESDRQRRRLAERGRLSWRMVMPDGVTDKTVETFLSLEHDSWKGDSGTSLLSRDQDAAFFRRLVPVMAKTGEIFFTELCLNEGAIASTANFMSRSVAFAYKVAWSKRFARFGPGILNEVSFIEHAATNELPFAVIESGTTRDSFIRRLWPGRMQMFNGYLIGGRFAKHAASALRIARRLTWSGARKKDQGTFSRLGTM